MARNTIQNNTLHNKLDHESFLPIANVSRIMKKSLPPNAKISKDAKETVQQCVSEFISFVTGEASDKCQREKRKTINGDDLLWAMTTLGFENYVGPLKVYLNKCNGAEGSIEKENDSSPSNDMIIGDYENVTGSSATKSDHLRDFHGGDYVVSLGLSQTSSNISRSVISYGENSVSTYGVEW